MALITNKALPPIPTRPKTHPLGMEGAGGHYRSKWAVQEAGPSFISPLSYSLPDPKGQHSTVRESLLCRGRKENAGHVSPTSAARPLSARTVAASGWLSRTRSTRRGFAAVIVSGCSGLRRWRRIVCAATAAIIGSAKSWRSGKGRIGSIVFVLVARLILILWSQSSTGSTPDSSGASPARSNDGADNAAWKKQTTRRFQADAIRFACLAVILTALALLQFFYGEKFSAALVGLAAFLLYVASVYALGLAEEIRSGE